MYKINYRKIVVLFIFTALFFTTNLGYSADNGNIDVVLVMDSSGSMRNTDPQSLRIPAAKLFMSLLKDGDRASVISFSGEGNTLIDLTPVDSSENEKKLFEAAEAITSRGSYTNLYGALTKGMEVLAEDHSEGRTQIIILMSDGMMDVGDPVEDSRLVERIRSELSVTLEESGIKVYTIAFTENADRVLLERISKRTGGFYNLTLTDHDFHVVFTSIFESLKSPEMLPMSKNGFKVDNSVEEVTIVATKGSMATKIMLNSPDRQSYTSDTKAERVEWFPSNKFDMITVRNPAQGRWEILFSTGENNKAYIITDLKLKTNFDKLYSTYGEPRDVQVWLEKEGKILNEVDVLDKIELIMELTDPAGRTTKLKPFNKGDGTYVRSIAPFSPGNYKLKVIARGMTFERVKDFVFNVADIQESKEDVKHERVKKKKQEELLKKEQEALAAKEQEALTAEPQEEIDEEILWVKIAIYFVAINLILGLGILVFFKIRKSRKFKPLKLKNKDDTEEQETEKVQDEKEVPAVAEQKPEEEAPPVEAAEPAKQEQVEETTAEAAPEEAVSAQPSEEQTSEKEPEVQTPEEPHDANDQEIALDDIDTGSVESTEASADNQEIALDTEDGQNEPDSLMNQDDLDALLAAAPEREPVPEEAPEVEGVKEEVDIQDILSDVLENTEEEKEPEAKAETAEEAPSEESKEEESVDDMWAEAFKEAEGEKEPEVKTEAEAPEEKAPEAKAETAEDPQPEESKEEESVDDMWAEAFKEAEGEKEPEVKTEAEAPEEKAPEAKAETAEEPQPEESKEEESVDDMWAEAFKEVEESSEKNANLPKPDIAQGEDSSGEEPIDN